jgi:hypothetical protein
MYFQGINLRKASPATLRILVQAGTVALRTKAEHKQLQVIIVEAVRSGSFPAARNVLLLGLHLDYTGTFQTVRKKGLFRYYGYLHKKCPVKGLAAEMLVELPQLSTPVLPADHQYLQSVINLADLSGVFAKLDASLLQEIAWFRRAYPTKSLLKTLLAYADSLFLHQHYPVPDPSATGLASRSKEEIAAAVSFLTHTIVQRKPNTIQPLYFISEEYILGGRIATIVEAACVLDELKEAELLVEHFRYQCVRQGKAWELVPPSETFARSLQLGYIRTELQALQDDRPPEESQSLAQLVAVLVAQQEVASFELVDSYAYPRYRLALAEPVYEMIVDQLFRHDALFQEEVVYLNHIFKEQLLEDDDLDTIIIRDTLSLMGFIKFQRIFRLFYALFSEHLATLASPPAEVVLRSLIPTFGEAQLYYLLDRLDSKQNVTTYLDLVCWEPGEDFFFDVQYHPILFVEGQFLLPMGILAQANYLRNLFASEHKRGTKTLLTDGTRDRLVDDLAAAFTRAGMQCFPQIKVPDSDLDLLVVYGDTLFFLECKHSLLPVSAFDLRTTYDYLRKAETQLDHLQHLYASGDLRPRLEAKCDLDLSCIRRTVSGIVLSNRMFNGNAWRYPVRNVHEVSNFVLRGTLRTKQGTFSLWKGEQLTVADLIDYFSLDNALVSLLHESLSVRKISHTIGDFCLQANDYFLEVGPVETKLASYTSSLPKVG